jgi:hypothetical protein
MLVSSYFSTFSALAFVIFGYIGMFKRKLMTSYAMRFSVIYGSYPYPSKDVLLRRYGLKMIRINTTMISTLVVKCQALWDFVFKQFVRKSMSLIKLIFYNKSSVTFLIFKCFPNPASRFMFFHFCQKMFLRVNPLLAIVRKTSARAVFTLSFFKMTWASIERRSAVFTQYNHITSEMKVATL